MGAWRKLLAALGLCLALGAAADELKEGRDFRLIDPPVATDNSKIEVTEFFWYGCPHCNELEPLLAAWVRKLPADVSFRRVPALFPNDKWVVGTRLYYTLEAMNLVDKLHAKVFSAIHAERQRLDDEKALLEWVTKIGIDGKKFAETWSSFGVQSRVQQARRLSLAAGLSGVPALMVQGRYLALATGDNAQLLAVVGQLIERSRAEAAR